MKTQRHATSLEIICFYTGFVVYCMSLLMIIPLLTAIVYQEWNPALDFLVGISGSLIFGLTLMIFGHGVQGSKSDFHWKHGFAVAALSWLFLTFLCAIPYRLSGHNPSWLNSMFDVMSGFTTTGLVLTQDLDHLSNALNMWRHMLTFIGGQGMVVLALTFLVKEARGAYKMYVGEGKDIELLPSMKGTAGQIWKISLIYLVLGTALLWVTGIAIGLRPDSAFLHALYIFESAWSTGGFAPNTQNIMYYHSVVYETITILIFILGSFNFGLHYAMWHKNRRELTKNIETRSFFITSSLISVLAVLGLSKLSVYPDALSAFRRVVYNVLSAHTTTGFGSIYARQFAREWGDFGIFLMVIAMLIGGSACSTAGGFKGLRVGIVFKGLLMDIKKLLSPERNLRSYTYHHIKNQVLDDAVIKSSALIILCYVVLMTIGTLLGAYYGYPLSESAFESASVAGNVGLSIGVTTPDMPTLMKIYYIFAMYLGRLEFLSVFSLLGSIGGGLRHLWKRTSKLSYSA